ncbi:MAG: FAD-dependent oxidoreductase [Kiloniellaceae bacterium]
MTQTADVIVIGAGMAGASAAAEMSRGAKVVVLESEAQPGHHSTGRSAAIFIQSYGNAAVRQLNRASRPLLEAHPFDPDGAGVLSPRGILTLAGEDETAKLDELLGDNAGVEEISPGEACELVPILRREPIARAAYEADALDIDVDRLHQLYLRKIRASGGEVLCNAAVTGLSRDGGTWRVETRAGVLEAPVVVNAAGAWADLIAEMAGVAPLGLTPLRRSAAILPAPPGHSVEYWPLTGNASETYYFKPEAGKLMVSPADETPVDPHDAWPDDMDLAEGLDRFSQAVTYEVTRVERSWAGLRTFAPDRALVIGFDPTAEGFFWQAGQGGYGIQTAPGAARLAAGLLLEGQVPGDLAAGGLDPAPLSPQRFRT